jgi:hypothetical protein
MAALRRKRTAAAALPAAAVLLAALLASASAEVVQRGGVRVSIAGKMTPSALPRTRPAAVAMVVDGRISAAGSGALPKLEEISFEINSQGKLNYRRIPVCRLGRIDPSTTAEALAACRSSLVGEGHFSANVKIPEQSPFPSEGKVLAFNGRVRGKPAIFAHIYGTDPVPTSYVLPFLVTRARGAFGTALEASLPRVTGEWGYVTGVRLRLQPRLFAASCPAPAGASAAVFQLLRARFGFDGGLELAPTLIRSCTVRAGSGASR